MNIQLSNIFCVFSLALVFSVTGCSGDSNGSSTSADSSGRTGISGSTARMVIDDNYLYAISGSTVQLFDIQEPSTPNAIRQVQIDLNIETLFPYGDYLLVGAADGIHILDNSDRASPVKVGEFRHAITRDPVVAQDDVAYATLRRDDTQWGNGIVNQLNVIDISDVSNPQLKKTIELVGPSGLSVNGNRLYVCDGDSSLIAYDIGEKLNPVLIHQLQNVECNDVIANQDTLHVIGPEAYSQYNTALTSRPQLMSAIRRQSTAYRED